MMERQLRHMTRLLDDLLDVSRISRGKIALHVERTELHQVLQAAIEASRPLIDEMGHEFHESVPAEPVWLHADPVRLAQVVSNLLNNAARYTPPGGRIALEAKHCGDEVEISVTDNGIGIPAESLDSVFDMFTQAGGPESRYQGGLGIGLALVKGLVALHGGTIEACSDGSGCGSRFRVRLPTQSTRPGDSAAPPESAEAPPRVKILVVDDNRDVAASLSMLLDLMGHDVRVAYDGEKAVQLAGEFRPQIVLLDLGMPNVDGYETCRRIRNHGWGADMTLIAVSGWGQDEDRRRSATAGFDAHLVKPVSPETLAELSSRLPSPAQVSPFDT
jgi:CheY-like chemotaxis protein/two-component sensor histidine kinase